MRSTGVPSGVTIGIIRGAESSFRSTATTRGVTGVLVAGTRTIEGGTGETGAPAGEIAVPTDASSDVADHAARPPAPSRERRKTVCRAPVVLSEPQIPLARDPGHIRAPAERPPPLARETVSSMNCGISPPGENGNARQPLA